LSEKPAFQALTENRQWRCWCCLFRHSVPDTGTSNYEDPAADCWKPDGSYQQATRLDFLSCYYLFWFLCPQHNALLLN